MNRQPSNGLAILIFMDNYILPSCYFCPKCNQRVHASIIEVSFMSNPEWTSFFGESKAHRRGVCRGQWNDEYKFTHFKVKHNGKVTHRLSRHKK